MSSQAPADEGAAAAATKEEEGEYVDILVPGLAHSLHVALPRGCALTTVKELRDAALCQVHSVDGSGVQYIRLIFRGKELKDLEATLSSQSIQRGSTLHGMLSRVQPHSQKRENEAAAARRAARQVLTSAVGSWLGGDAAEGGTADPAAVTAGARAQMSQGELMRLLHEETMLRQAEGRGVPRRRRSETGPGGTAAPMRGGPVPLAREETVETVDGGRARVVVLEDLLAQQQQRLATVRQQAEMVEQRQLREEALRQLHAARQELLELQQQFSATHQRQLQEAQEQLDAFQREFDALQHELDAAVELEHEALSTAEQTPRDHHTVLGVAALAGFSLGPAALLLPFERGEVACVVAGFLVNVGCLCLW